jgi:hypothetical protein
MCLAVVSVAVVAMSVVGRGSATAMVEEVVMAAAEEAGNEQGGRGLRINLEEPARVTQPNQD